MKHILKTAIVIQALMVFTFAQTITSISPNQSEQASELSVNITGQNTSFRIDVGSFSSNNVQNVFLRQNQDTIKSTNISTSSFTNLSANFAIPATTPLGLYDVVVVQGGSAPISLSNGFTVTAISYLVLNNPNPASADQGDELSVSITGQNTSFRISVGSASINNVERVFIKQQTDTITATTFNALSYDNLNAYFVIPKDALAGSYDLYVVEKTKIGLISNGFTINARSNWPPVFTSTQLTMTNHAVQDSPYTDTLHATDPDQGDIISYHLISPFPASILLDPTVGIIQWTPTNADIGRQYITAVVRDIIGEEDTLQFFVDVENVNDKPVFLSKTPDMDTVTIYEGDSIIFSVDVEDIDSENLVYLWQVNSSDVSSRTTYKHIAGKESAGKYTVKLYVNDGQSTVSATWLLNIEESTPIVANTNIPEQFALISNFPNPFATQTKITYAIPMGQHSQLTIGVYDLEGKLLTTLFENKATPGYHSVIFKSDFGASKPLESGMYIVKMNSNKFQKTMKINLMK
ncbi:MAG: T9SS type A sorting domain-containing protein [Fibrobacteria bacterium]|nr:T9SS type A sorting domain-containing protein [Fibrobacteria bacterium]